MDKQQKQEMGQGLVDFMLDDLSLDEIAEAFFLVIARSKATRQSRKKIWVARF